MVRPEIGFNLDIVGGAVGSLCEARREVTRYEQGVHSVNLLFDRETDAPAVESPYTHDALTVWLKKPWPLFVRVLPWVERRELRITGASSPARWTGDYLFVGNQNVAESIRISFPMKEHDITLRAPHPRPIRVRLRGDAVTAMDNYNSRLTFFPPFEESADP